jgi:cell division protein FtsI (penicillin-binding protein 3)
MGENSVAFQRRSTKLLILFGFILLLVGIFLSSVLRTIDSSRHLPKLTATVHDRSMRGKIISKDPYTLALPHKIYKAVVFAPGIDPDKRDMFIRLFGIYSGMSEEDIKQSFLDRHGRSRHGYVTISKTIDAATAISLKSLSYKLRRLRVFRPIKNSRGINIVHGLDIVESGEEREFPFGDVLEPVLGYIKKTDNGKYAGVKGVKGLERHYQEHLSSGQDGFVTGKRDVAGIIIRNAASMEHKRIDGMDLHLNIPLSLQRRVELALDKMKQETGAQEIIAGVMESRTGRVVSLASTERYDPAHITQKDVSRLNPKFGEYTYEAGSVIKPITLSVAIEHHKVTPDTWFDVHGGKLKISQRYTISDDEVFDSLTATDIIVHSSNVGISQIAWRLTGKQMHDGFTAFGLGQPSGIDLSRELHGKIKSAKLLSIKVHRANQAYGYGMTVTFAQLFKAYSTFNNDGVAVTPRIIDYFSDNNGSRYHVKPKYGNRRVISKHTARQIKTILKEVVKRGTGVAAQYPGLEIGGKTGTAHIAVGGHYRKIYNSSFYGFANDDKGDKYTIGVLVIKASKPKMYFASKSAVPTFRAIVDILVDQGFLKPNLTAIQQKQREELARKERELAKKKQQERTRRVKAKLKAQREEMLRKQSTKRKQRKREPRTSSRPAAHTMHPTAQATPPVTTGTKPQKHRTPHDEFPDMF